MMRTEDLIATLVANPRPAPHPAPRLALAAAAGAAIVLAGLVMALGSPIGAIAERGAATSIVKLSYPLALGLIALAAALAAGRPGARPGPLLAWLALPVVVVVLLAAADLAAAPQSSWQGLLLGSTTVRCLTAVTLGSIPALVVSWWAFRILAPTNLRLAGFLLGLAAGGISAAVYALYCTEASPAFLLAVYTPAMLVPALAGLAAGRLIMRW